MIKWVGVGLFSKCGVRLSINWLEHISSADFAFITALSVVAMPFLALIFLKSKPRWFDFVMALLYLGGIFILTGAIHDFKNPDGGRL